MLLSKKLFQKKVMMSIVILLLSCLSLLSIDDSYCDDWEYCDGCDDCDYWDDYDECDACDDCFYHGLDCDHYFPEIPHSNECDGTDHCKLRCCATMEPRFFPGRILIRFHVHITEAEIGAFVERYAEYELRIIRRATSWWGTYSFAFNEHLVANREYFLELTREDEIVDGADFDIIFYSD